LPDFVTFTLICFFWPFFKTSLPPFTTGLFTLTDLIFAFASAVVPVIDKDVTTIARESTPANVFVTILDVLLMIILL
jgi:hypothetical protein